MLNLALLPGEQSQYSGAGPEALQGLEWWYWGCGRTTGPGTRTRPYPHPLQAHCAFRGPLRWDMPSLRGGWVVLPRYTHPSIPHPYHTRPRTPHHAPLVHHTVHPGACPYDRFEQPVGEPRGVETHSEYGYRRVNTGTDGKYGKTRVNTGKTPLNEG